jgi:hypothetical protein
MATVPRRTGKPLAVPYKHLLSGEADLHGEYDVVYI